MPAFPHSVRRILALTQDASVAPRDVVEVIRGDPVLALKVLRVVNSPYYGLPKSVTSIEQAVVFLGFNAIKNLALSVAAVSMVPDNPLQGLDGQRYLDHSLICAVLARALASGLADADPSDCFMAGLLHDMGKVAVAQFMPTEYQRAVDMSVWTDRPLFVCLTEVIGIDHAEIGAQLAHKWRFDANLVQTIRCQHRPHEHDTGMMACVFAANQISKRLDHDFGAPAGALSWPDSVARRLGATMEDALTGLGDTQALLQQMQPWRDPRAAARQAAVLPVPGHP